MTTATMVPERTVEQRLTNLRRANTMFSEMHGSEASYRPFVDNARAADVPKLTEKTYRPRGGTPLYDAIGHTIEKMDAAVADAKGKPTVLFVIQTDGEENASKEYGRKQIVDLIQAREKSGWKIIYLGANQDAFTAERLSQSLGLTRDSSFSYAGATTNATYASLGAATAAAAADPTMTSAQVTHAVKITHKKKTT